MSQTSEIAVLLATYNGEKYLKQQLDSILFQTYQNFKIYISDDNSTDTTQKILEEYKLQHPDKLFYSVNNTNIGFIGNFEKLLQECNSDYIALCDQDDIWYRNKLQVEFDILQEYKECGSTILVHSDLCMVDNNMHVLNSSYFKYRGIELTQDKAINKIISHNGVMGCTMLFNKELKEKALPFPEKLNAHDYWLAIVNEVFGKRITINNTLIYYRIHEKNTSNSKEKILKKRSFFKSIFNKDELPFINIGREDILKEFLARYDLEEKDVLTIKAFNEYLEGNRNRFLIIYKLIKYNFLKNNIRYKLKIFLKILFRKQQQTV